MASAIVLVGGEGRRLGGADKSSLVIGGRTVLDREIEVVRPLVDDVVIVAARPRTVPAGARLVLDRYPGKGALGGLYTGLATMSGSHGLVLAGDLPFLNRALLAFLLGLSSGFDVVVPKVERHAHTLAAVYSKGCLESVEARLRQDRLKIVEFFDEVRVRYVDEPEVDRFDPAHLTFFNVNTPEDLARAEEIAATLE